MGPVRGSQRRKAVRQPTTDSNSRARSTKTSGLRNQLFCRSLFTGAHGEELLASGVQLRQQHRVELAPRATTSRLASSERRAHELPDARETAAVERRSATLAGSSFCPLAFPPVDQFALSSDGGPASPPHPVPPTRHHICSVQSAAFLRGYGRRPERFPLPLSPTERTRFRRSTSWSLYATVQLPLSLWAR